MLQIYFFSRDDFLLLTHQSLQKSFRISTHPIFGLFGEINAMHPAISLAKHLFLQAKLFEKICLLAL